MSKFKEQKVKIEVISSQCELYKAGDKIVIDGPLLDVNRSNQVCITALQAMYPFIFALRKGVTPEALGFSSSVMLQCPDNCAPVVFTATTFCD